MRDKFLCRSLIRKRKGVHIINKIYGFSVTLITDRVRSTTGRLCFDTCLSVCSWGYPSQVQLGGGTPTWSSPQGVPPTRGYPTSGTLQPGLMGVPEVEYPPAGMGYPPARSHRGYLRWGTPWQRYPPVGGTPHTGQ